jgi:hypothetical protein
MDNILNLVYDIWDGDTPIFNGKRHYPNKNFWDFEDFIKSYINSFSNGDESGKIMIKNHKIKDVYNEPNEKFYYVICHGSLNIDEIINNKLILSEEIIKCLMICKNFNLVFFSHHESDNENGFASLNNTSLPHEQIYVVNNNYKLNHYVINYKSKINVYSVMYLPIVVSLSLEKNDIPFNTYEKDKFFMCFNRGVKIHRCGVLIYMLKNKLLDDTNWSFIPLYSKKCQNSNYLSLFDDDELETLHDEIEYIDNLKIKISDTEVNDLEFDDNNEITVINPIYVNRLYPPDMSHNYKNAYINIVTESQFIDLGNVVHITEKSFKPFFYYQFPIILATHHHIKCLKEKYDFDFFDDIINHEYDNEPNQKKRFKMITKELKRLHENKKSVIEFYLKNSQRFENNRNKVIQISKNKSDYLFMKNLLN